MPSAAEIDLVPKFASQVLNPKSNISRSGIAEAAAKVLTDEMNALSATKKATVYEYFPQNVKLRKSCLAIFFNFFHPWMKTTRFSKPAATFPEASGCQWGRAGYD